MIAKARVLTLLTNGLGALTRRSDLALAALLAGVVFMLVVPLPTLVIDVLIALNLGMAALLLMVVIYIPSPVAFTSFPSVLLVTTLFRLALTIATTRLILLNADAGHIVEAFGQFAVGGNLVVGLVIFLILTVVQFIVITKGAERVAEVAARFSLDSLPGKQMSIDGDMRAGFIDMEEARARRTLLEKESQLYGAMDGAMKFVKGDAIAGIIIVAVNLIGGVAIGVLQKGLSFGDALHTYSVLTIGDGLIAQIPALFIAITAGVLITRVKSDDADAEANLGQEISDQMLSRPWALLLAGFIMMLLGLVPGMPMGVFFALATVSAVIGWVRLDRSGASVRSLKRVLRTALRPLEKGSAFTDAPAKGAKPSAEIFFPTVPLLLELSESLREAFDPGALDAKLLMIRQGLYYDLGVAFPGIHLRFNAGLATNDYVLFVHEVPVTQGRLRPGCVLAQESEANLEAMGLPFELDEAFLTRWPTIWVNESELEDLRFLGVPFMDLPQILVHHIASVLKRYPAEFLGIQETRFLIGKMEGELPDLMKELQRVVPTQRIADILARLVAEGVSIRNMRAIAEALIEWAQKEKDPILLTEHVRMCLRRQISHRFSTHGNVMPAHVISDGVEEMLREAIRQTSNGSYLALEPDVSSRLVEKIRNAVGDLTRLSSTPVILTAIDVRRYLRKLLEQDLFEVPVMSFQELSFEVSVQALSHIDLD
ncbi:type III secretion system export apparatus subunit SctV [Variovorax saccharolyticus]|uniref:type III secretion system export apparatus subunit SctV n=1 Tax=Variovorax saccharolyticus TaxID=3053516 RepID=UPI002575616D|nr:type III secretion system export apparatus subunit SctV [Variovorax sp. J31P216]MDM0030173.1 type III secretion system export apparatus subunit SctV [Variovorax sp. J31P216]